MTADDEDAELDHARMFDEVEKVVKSSCTVAEGMSRIVEVCGASRPHPDWERFLKLDFAADLEHLRGWLMDVFSDAPDEEDDGVWFGLFNPSYDGEDAADMHVLASPYDPESSGEWASEVSWRPYDDCARSRVLKRIFDVAYGGKGLSFDDEDRATDTVEPLGNLGNAERRILFVGFDSGDYICIGALTEGGLQFSQDSFEFEAES